jgi:hypothetical protein
MKLKFWENLLHLLNWNSVKFETNPTVDLRAIIILIKNPGASLWKSFHELYYNYLLHITFLHGFCLHTFFFPMNNTFRHIRIKKISHTHSHLSPSKKHTQDNTFFCKPPIAPPWACSPCPVEGWKYFPSINGLFILHDPMIIENDFSLLWDLGENS